MTSDFLLEIGCEELPAKSANKLAQALLQGICEGLDNAGLSYADARWLTAPRRLAIQISQLQAQQAEQTIERKGPPLKAAYDKTGQPSKALQGFLRSCNLTDANDLQQHETAKGVWLMYKGIRAGQAASDLLPDIIRLAIKRLPIPKPMRWGAHKIEFIRPVHWLVMLLDTQVIETNLLGVDASNITYGHRFMAPAAITLPHANTYVDNLEQQGRVMVDAEKRQQLIREQSHLLAKRVDGEAVIDDKLLDEVSNLVEWPVPLLASFSADFLQVPAEALIAAMQGHQKCFAVQNTKQQLLPYFITVSNIETADPTQIIQGNEKVMTARLSDAKFFYDVDSKQRLDARLPALNAVIFQKQLGTLHDKALRISNLAKRIATELNADPTQAAHAGLLCKADLVSEMVGEFPELQGIMGDYYARQGGESEATAQAIREHYQPKFAGDQLPGSAVSCAVALADKLDTLIGIFGIKQMPTGDKDPFALRRAAMGIVRILLEKQLPLDIKQLIHLSIDNYGDKLCNEHTAIEVKHFIFERLRSWYRDRDVSADMFAAVLATDATQLTDFDARINAVIDFMQLPQAKALSEANKRVRNILQKNAAANYLNHQINQDLFTDGAEKQLIHCINKVDDDTESFTKNHDYTGILTQLATLQKPLENYFNDVMVMTDDLALRKNRLCVLHSLRESFLSVADISLL